MRDAKLRPSDHIPTHTHTWLAISPRSDQPPFIHSNPQLPVNTHSLCAAFNYAHTQHIRAPAFVRVCFCVHVAMI